MWSDLHLLRPWWLLALLPLAWVMWRVTQHKSKSDPWRNLVDPHLLPHLLVGDMDIKSYGIILWLLGLGGIIWIVALAGPTWRQLPQPIYRTQTRLVIALDLSLSMNTNDILPSRLAQARFKVLDLLRGIREGQVAMLTYGAEPFIVSPLTTDAATIAAQIPLLNNSLLPTQGERRTDLAITYAENLLHQAGSLSGEVLLITDAIAPLAATQQAASNMRNRGYRLSILGVGTTQGAPIPMDEGGFVKDANGAILLAQLELDNLQAVAASGGGKYFNATIDNQDLETLLPQDRQTSTFQQASPQATQADRWREEGPWLLLLLLPLAASGFRRGWLSLILLCLYLAPLRPAQAFGWQDLWQYPDQQAANQLAAGQPRQAAQNFQRPDWRAAAQYKAGDYAAALDSLQQIENADVDYNRGNVLAKLGRLQEALAAYEQALAKNPQDQDAQANRDLVQRVLQQQQQQQQQSQTQNNSQQQDKQQNQQPQQKQAKPSAAKQAPDQQANQEQQTSAANPANKQPPQQSAKPASPQPDIREAGKPEPATAQEPQDVKSGATDSIMTQAEQAQRERQQAMEYQLNQVPDDSGGIMRQLFILQHLQRQHKQY